MVTNGRLADIHFHLKWVGKVGYDLKMMVFFLFILSADVWRMFLLSYPE